MLLRTDYKMEAFEIAQKFYIVQAGFLPVGASDVTGWRSHSFYSGRRAYDDAMAEYEKEVRKNLHPRRMFRVVCTEHCSRKDTYTYVCGFESSAKTL